MNWKLIIGASLIFAGVKELVSKTFAYKDGISHFNLFYTQLACIAVVGAGAFLLYKGRLKKTCG
jgi:hypothetical protein